MCDAVKKYARKYAKEHAKEYAEEYAKEVNLEEKTKSIKEMLDDQMPIELIAKYVRLSVDEVRSIIESQLETV